MEISGSTKRQGMIMCVRGKSWVEESESEKEKAVVRSLRVKEPSF
jgi:hypothetical protein